MTVKINSNGASLAAQRQVAQTSGSLSRVFERLSSGQRINRASDDAAGLAIADSLHTKSRVFTQGVRNLNDGISLLSVADAAVSSLTDITVRLKELAEQSSNGVYSSKQRKALDNEAQALSAEFTRITQSTTFNGLNLFDGSIQGINLQAGFGAAGSISTSLGGDKGSADFTSVFQSAETTSATKILTNDFNGDGILDILYTTSASATSKLALGKGDGTFLAGVTTAFDAASIVDLIDIDGDQRKDILLGDGSYLKNLGNGSFAPAVTLVPNGGVSAGDINNDGSTDLAVYNSGVVKIFLNNGQGSFRLANSFSAPLAGYNKIADFDGDGVADISTVDIDASTFTVYKGNGNGYFTAGIVTSFASESPYDRSASYADFNNDGVTDIALSTFTGDPTAFNTAGSVSIFLGSKNGTFSQTASYAATADVDIDLTLNFTDFNGDGILDLVNTDANDQIAISLGDGRGHFNKKTNYDAGVTSTSVAVGDFNGDGTVDIASTLSFFNSFDVALNGKIDGISSFSPFSLNGIQSSRDALTTFSTKLTALSQQRAQIGASQSRIDTAVNVLQGTTENFSAAESRIRDTDVAKDSADLTRLQILQEAGLSVLSQANLQPQLALKLLRD